MILKRVKYIACDELHVMHGKNDTHKLAENLSKFLSKHIKDGYKVLTKKEDARVIELSDPFDYGHAGIRIGHNYDKGNRGYNVYITSLRTNEIKALGFNGEGFKKNLDLSK